MQVLKAGGFQYLLNVNNYALNSNIQNSFSNNVKADGLNCSFTAVH